MAEAPKPGSQVVPRTSVVDSLTKSKTDPLKAELERYQNLAGDDLLGLAGRTGTREKVTGYTYKRNEGSGRQRDEMLYMTPEEYSKRKALGNLPSDVTASKEMETYDLTPEERLAQANMARQEKIAGFQSQLADPSQLFTGVEGDLIKGATLGEAALGPEGLGRLGTDAETQDVLARYKGIADQGLSRQEMEAQRADAFAGIDRNTQTSQRSLQAALARSGVKGAVAGQQMLQGQAQGLTAKAGVERDLFLKSEELKRSGLQDYSSRLGEVKTFDIGQAAKEKDIALQTGLAFAQMGSAKDIAKLQSDAAESAAKARAQASSSCFLGSVKVIMENGDLKPIGQIALNDYTSTGKVISVSKHLAQGSNLYDVYGNIMTGNHIIFHEGKYVMAMDVGYCLNWEGEYLVYDLIIDEIHRIELEGGLMAIDQDGFDMDAQAMADFLNETMEAYNEFTKKVSGGKI